eukprot:scaffold37583_cov19-Tisochrysis_lutea.AAC.1
MVDASMVSLKPPALAIETNRVRLSHFVIVGRACTGLGETDRIRLLHLLNAGWACSWEEADITRLSLHFNVELLAFETNRVRLSHLPNVGDALFRRQIPVFLRTYPLMCTGASIVAVSNASSPQQASCTVNFA